MKRPSDWPLYFVLYPMIFRICPVPILVIVQEILKQPLPVPNGIVWFAEPNYYATADLNMKSKYHDLVYYCTPTASLQVSFPYGSCSLPTIATGTTPSWTIVS